jgi:hypothetical protein
MDIKTPVTGRTVTRRTVARGAASAAPAALTASTAPAFAASAGDTNNEGKFRCVAKTGSPVFPGDATYPPSGKRLAADSTFVTIGYTRVGSATVHQLSLTFDDTVGCRVVAGCV